MPVPLRRHSRLPTLSDTRYARKCALLAVLALLVSACATEGTVVSVSDTPVTNVSITEDSASYWRAQGDTALRAALASRPVEKKAKGIILFVGDGMGVTTITSARWLAGEQAGKGNSEGHQLYFEQFPHLALMKTYNINKQTPDSAGTMSAMITGVKTDAGILSLAGGADLGDCKSAEGQQVETLLERLEARGWATGVVSTARLTHATPAATYAHSPARGWESDGRIAEDQRAFGCKDIARQLVEFGVGNGLEVAMGGGREHFLPADVVDPEFPARSGWRTDGRNLAEEWASRDGAMWVWNEQQLADVDTSTTKHLLGLFNSSHMQYELDRPNDAAGEPSLAQMTRKALEILGQNENGFFLVVEAGRIDHAHHATNAKRALTDTIALAEAVRVADQMTQDDDTLLIVTADHSHVFSVAGYSERGNPVLGVAAVDGIPVLAEDGKPYTTLGYANGRGGRMLESGVDEVGSSQIYDGQVTRERRLDLTDVNTTDEGYFQESFVPLSSETHGAEDVALFAKGPWAHLFTGTAEQSYIFYVMQHAAGASD